MGDSIFFKLFFTFCYAKRFFFSPIWFMLVKNQSLNWVFPFLGLVWFLLTQFMLLMLNFGLLKYRAGLFFLKKTNSFKKPIFLKSSVVKKNILKKWLHFACFYSETLAVPFPHVKKLFQFGVPEMSFNSHWGILVESPADMCLVIY